MRAAVLVALQFLRDTLCSLQLVQEVDGHKSEEFEYQFVQRLE
jgi:hypothetical protein